MRHQNIAADLFIRNRKKLTEKLSKGSMVIVNSNDEMPRNGDQCFPFRQHSDFFYLTGIQQEQSRLVLYPEHPVESLREVLFILKADKTMEIWNGHKLTPQEATDISGIKTVKFISDFEFMMQDYSSLAGKLYLNANEYSKFVTDVPSRDLRFTESIRKQYPLLKLKRLAPIMHELRTVKEEEELQIMQKACSITKDAFERVLKTTRPGMMEYQVEAEITHEFIRQGSSGHAYAPIVAGGKNACVLHYIDNDMQLQDGDLMLMDFGAEYANYAADLSRTIPVNGKFTARQKDCYNAVLRVFKKARQLFVPGNTINEVNRMVNSWMEEEMIQLGLFTAEEVKNQPADSPMYFNYFMHGTTHFIGLDVHDVGQKHTPFQKGMVLTCEPGLYIADENIGIRIENDIMVDEVPVDLMANIPIEADDIEALMQ